MILSHLLTYILNPNIADKVAAAIVITMVKSWLVTPLGKEHNENAQMLLNSQPSGVLPSSMPPIIKKIMGSATTARKLGELHVEAVASNSNVVQQNIERAQDRDILEHSREAKERALTKLVEELSERCHRLEAELELAKAKEAELAKAKEECHLLHDQFAPLHDKFAPAAKGRKKFTELKNSHDSCKNTVATEIWQSVEHVVNDKGKCTPQEFLEYHYSLKCNQDALKALADTPMWTGHSYKGQKQEAFNQGKKAAEQATKDHLSADKFE